MTDDQTRREPAQGGAGQSEGAEAQPAGTAADEQLQPHAAEGGRDRAPAFTPEESAALGHDGDPTPTRETPEEGREAGLPPESDAAAEQADHHAAREPWDRPVDLGKEAQSVPQLCDTPMPDDLKAEMQARMESYPDHRSAALPCLAAAQRVHGWLSPEAFRQVAAVMQVTPAYLASVATFYDMFETKPRGRHKIYMCTNISCMLRGADQVLEALEAETGASEGTTSEDGEIYLRKFECLGACDMAPMASVDGTFVGPLTVADAKELVADIRAGREVLPAKALKQNSPTAAAAGGPTAGSPGNN